MIMVSTLIAPVDAPANPYFILVEQTINRRHTLRHADTCLIAAGALYGCNQLTSITIPAKVSFIEAKLLKLSNVNHLRSLRK